MTGYLTTLTLFRNADVADPLDVTLPMWHLAVAFGLAGALGALCALAVGGADGTAPSPAPSPAAAPVVPAASLALAPGERADSEPDGGLARRCSPGTS